ncbi:hypothetical protein CES85_0610 [Ochrobactrum quorumnocens]|uniref:Uncharacterized protein n=1 Tax=Ochrobactrum quorumnocens TaxID=271865 RepID=A0A248UI59_9HYPH|nr:hypothetical protein CES85_0610 [[Ochrobactrum] quorumnocens]
MVVVMILARNPFGICGLYSDKSRKRHGKPLVFVGIAPVG